MPKRRPPALVGIAGLSPRVPFSRPPVRSSHIIQVGPTAVPEDGDGLRPLATDLWLRPFAGPGMWVAGKLRVNQVIVSYDTIRPPCSSLFT